MGNKYEQPKMFNMEICPDCNVPYTKFTELALSVTIDKKVYTIHQHGQNIIVSRYHDYKVCTYKSDIIDRIPICITSSIFDNTITNKAYKKMCLKIFTSKNTIKLLVLNELNIFPLDIIVVIVHIWKSIETYFVF